MTAVWVLAGWVGLSVVVAALWALARRGRTNQTDRLDREARERRRQTCEL